MTYAEELTLNNNQLASLVESRDSRLTGPASNLEKLYGSFDQCPQRCQCINGNTITGYHYNDEGEGHIQ